MLGDACMVASNEPQRPAKDEETFGILVTLVTLCELPDDVIDYMSTFLLGIEKLYLRTSCSRFHRVQSLMYDGPRVDVDDNKSKYTTSRSRSRSVVHVYLYQQKYANYLLQTENKFYYTTCPKPTTRDIFSWLQNMAIDPNVPAPTFACAFHKFYKITYEPTCYDYPETFVYNVVDNVTPCTLTRHDQDFQYAKLSFLLQNYSVSPSTLIYIFASACLYCHLPLLDDLLSEYQCKANVHALTVTLVSGQYPDSRTKQHVLRLLLNSNKDEVLPVQNNCWPLVYTAFDEAQTDEFNLLYTHVILQTLHSHTDTLDLETINDTICSSFHESSRDVIAHQLNQIKNVTIALSNT